MSHGRREATQVCGPNRNDDFQPVLYEAGMRRVTGGTRAVSDPIR
ncbi:hypothetical protein BJ996_000774 [Streptomyces phaeogriseichromatogenes]|nr:hypothetical protein [Streptomyces murinus]